MRVVRQPNLMLYRKRQPLTPLQRQIRDRQQERRMEREYEQARQAVEVEVRESIGLEREGEGC